MTTFQQLFTGSWANALGWSLLHSLWQALIVFAIIWLLLKFLSPAYAKLRYAIACAGLLLITLTSISTFVLKFEKSPVTSSVQNFLVHPTNNFVQTSESRLSFDGIVSYLESNMSVFLYAWIIGAMLFSLRLAAGWWHLNKLQRQSNTISGDWYIRLNEMAARLNINKIIRLAESRSVHSPMVIGFIKPIILFPMGMVNGLTTEEMETILLHELAHIKRHDFLINIIQSFVEIIFFFNPFVWLISGIIRREREYCCDDAVVKNHGNVLAYAYALTRLEESRMTSNTLALSLTDNKNHLLNRIKRMMEKSFKPQLENHKIMSAVILLGGLLCASWLTISNETKAVAPNNLLSEISPAVTVADTTKKKKSNRFDQQTVKGTGANGENIEIDVQSPEAPDPLIPHFTIPDFPDPVLAPDVVMPFIHLDMDTIPRGFHFQSEDWKHFSDEFENNFKERFGDFYKNHQHEFDDMMKDLEQRFEKDFDVYAIKAQEEALKNLEGQLALQEQHMMAFTEDVKKWEEKNQAHFAQVEENMKAIEKNIKEFDKILKDELIKDGYLLKDEVIKNIHWKINGDIEINNKKITDSDKKKYNDLHNKYFKDVPGDEFHYVE